MTETSSILVKTLNFGEIEIPESRVLSFKEGIPGFPQLHKFALVDFEELEPFHYLQALEDPPIALLVVNPFLVKPNYEFQLPPSDMADIGTADPAEVSVYVVATIPENPEDATVNLMAPIVINEKARLGKQVILHDSGNSVRHPLRTTEG